MSRVRRGRRTRVEELAERFVTWCRRWEGSLDRAPGLNDQVQRAGQSILANIGEGLDAESLAQKRKYFGHALASVGECLRLLRGARRSRLLPTGAVDDALRTLRDLKWDLLRLIGWTRR